MEIHLTGTECHLPYGIEITQCYVSPNTSEHTLPLPDHHHERTFQRST